MSSNPAKVSAIIPARIQSTRLPEKVMKKIGSKSMLEHTYTNVAQLELFENIIVATDSKKVFDHVHAFGGEAIMTSVDHICGTDRVAEAAQELSSDYILNVQADEPLIAAEHILPLIDLITQPKFQIGTIFSRVQDSFQFQNKNCVKVVCGKDSKCLYFSRSGIPCNRDTNSIDYFHRHQGVYLFEKHTLLEVVQLPKSRLEQIERLEQLRWLENGFTIYGAEVPNTLMSIDTAADLDKVRQLF